MINLELINDNEPLKGLTDEQKNAIVNLSKNDEDIVIAAKIGEIYGNIDNDVLETSKIEKNGTEKTYVYVKRVIGTLTDEREKQAKEIEKLRATNSDLKKAAEVGSHDEELKKELTTTKADRDSIARQYAELNAKYQEQESTHAAALKNLQVEHELTAAVAGVKFKAGISNEVARVLVGNVTEKIKAFGADYIDNGQGGKTLVFKNEKGEIRRNAANALNPYTAKELIVEELTKLDVVEPKLNTKGGGTTNNKHEPKTYADISSAKTRTEAMNIMDSVLVNKGLVRGSAAYQNELDEMWKQNSDFLKTIKL